MQKIKMMKNDSLIPEGGEALDEAFVIWHFSLNSDILVFVLEIESINWVLQAIEKIVTDAQSHWVGHPEAFKEIKVEFLLIFTFIIVVSVSLMDFYLVWQRFYDISLPHAVRAEESGFGKLSFLLAERNNTVQQAIVFEQCTSFSKLVVVGVHIFILRKCGICVEDHERVLVYPVVSQTKTVIQNTPLEDQELFLGSDLQQMVNADFEIRDCLIRLGFYDEFLSFEEDTHIHSQRTSCCLGYFFDVKDGVVADGGLCK